MNNLINRIRGKSPKPKGSKGSASKPLASQSEKQGPRPAVNLGDNSSAEFLQTVKARRTYYGLSNASPISDAEIRAIVESAVTHVPSSFNGQTSRAVLLTGKSHQKLWEIVKTGFIKSLGDKTPADIIKQNEDKIGGYAAGYGTVMFFEDQAGVERLARQLRFVADLFPTWSENATGMLQFVVWTALEAEGLGASLQHHAAYADEIASGIRSEFGLAETWKCTGLMPFGVPVGPPGQPGREKTFKPVGERVRVINEASVRSLTLSAPQPEPSPATSAAFLQTVQARRTYYGLSNTSPIPDDAIRAIVESAVTNVPSAFNSQTSRAIIVTGKSYQKLWEIVKTGYIKSLGDKAPADIIKQNEAKIAGYAAGYGTVLFFEDEAAIDALAAQIPPMAAHFPVWSQNATGMLQFTVWTALEAEGFGASLQHHASYADEIARGILSEFGLPATWKCTALLPFGGRVGGPGQPGREKTFKPIGERVRVIHDVGALQSTQQIVSPQAGPSNGTSAAFLQTVKARRTYYGISKASPVSDAEIRAIVESAVTNVPSAFNSQSSRAVVVTGKSYQKLWEIVRVGFIKSLGDKAPAAIIQQNEAKIGGYAAGYGTVLFFEDQATIDAFAAQIPAVAAHFPVWSQNATGMLQFTVWTALEAEGFGASLQHHAAYSEEIASGILAEFDLPETWKCTALMPFGVPLAPPGAPGREKTFKPIAERVKVIT